MGWHFRITWYLLHASIFDQCRWDSIALLVSRGFRFGLPERGRRRLGPLFLLVLCAYLFKHVRHLNHTVLLSFECEAHIALVLLWLKLVVALPHELVVRVARSHSAVCAEKAVRLLATALHICPTSCSFRLHLACVSE